MQTWVCKLVSEIAVIDNSHEANKWLLGSDTSLYLFIPSCFVEVYRTRMRGEEEEEAHILYLI